MFLIHNFIADCYSSASTGKAKIDTWTWPSGTSRDDALKTLSAVIDSYPQAGQSGVAGARPGVSWK